MYIAEIPSLQRIVIRSLIITEWNTDGIRTSMSEYNPTGNEIYEIPHGWQNIQDQVLRNIATLHQNRMGTLWDRMLKETSRIIEQIGLHILEWKNSHRTFFHRDVFPNYFIWTLVAGINKDKTIMTLIGNEHTDISERYELARTYCQDDCITLLKQLYPSWYGRGRPDVCACYESNIVSLWSGVFGDDVEDFYEPLLRYNIRDTDDSFLCAAFSGNKTSASYFLDRLAPQEETIGHLLQHVARKVDRAVQNNVWFAAGYFADVLCFLFSHLTKQNKCSFVRLYALPVLLAFLEWPWQDSFMETARYTLEHLTPPNFVYLLNRIADKIAAHFEDCDYKRLFEEFWQSSPAAGTEQIISQCPDGVLLSKLLRGEDIGNIGMILGHLNRGDKQRIILNLNRNVVERLLRQNEDDDNNLELLKFFFVACEPHQKSVDHFRQTFQPFVLHLRRDQMNNPIRENKTWSKFYWCLDECVKE